MMLQVAVGLAGDAIGLPGVAMDLARGLLHIPEQGLQLVDEAVDAPGQGPSSSPERLSRRLVRSPSPSAMSSTRLTIWRMGPVMLRAMTSMVPGPAPVR